MRAGWKPVITFARYGDFTDGELVAGFVSREAGRDLLVASGVARPAGPGDHPDAAANGELVLCDRWVPAEAPAPGGPAHRDLAARVAACAVLYLAGGT